MSLQVIQSSSYFESVGNPFCKLPRKSGGIVLLGTTYGEELLWGQELVIEITCLTTQYPWNRCLQHTHTLTQRRGGESGDRTLRGGGNKGSGNKALGGR